MVLNYCPA